MDAIQKAMSFSSERELIQFAKTDAISKGELYQVIFDKAQAKRRDGESREQAYARFIENDPLGNDLHKIFKAAAPEAVEKNSDEGHSDPGSFPPEKQRMKTTAAYEKLKEIAAATRRAHPQMSPEKAIATAISQNHDLYQQDKIDRLGAGY